MPPIEVGPASTVGAIEARLARVGSSHKSEAAAGKAVTTSERAPEFPAAPATSAALSVQTSAALDAGSPPVDTDRVAEIRKAVENGTYPVIPARIADAMIAAGVLLRSPR